MAIGNVISKCPRTMLRCISPQLWHDPEDFGAAEQFLPESGGQLTLGGCDREDR